jgi:hypothetical protein
VTSRSCRGRRQGDREPTQARKKRNSQGALTVQATGGKPAYSSVLVFLEKWHWLIMTSVPVSGRRRTAARHKDLVKVIGRFIYTLSADESGCSGERTTGQVFRLEY